MSDWVGRERKEKRDTKRKRCGVKTRTRGIEREKNSIICPEHSGDGIRTYKYASIHLLGRLHFWWRLSRGFFLASGL